MLLLSQTSALPTPLLFLVGAALVGLALALSALALQYACRWANVDVPTFGAAFSITGTVNGALYIGQKLLKAAGSGYFGETPRSFGWDSLAFVLATMAVAGLFCTVCYARMLKTTLGRGFLVLVYLDLILVSGVFVLISLLVGLERLVGPWA